MLSMTSARSACDMLGAMPSVATNQQDNPTHCNNFWSLFTQSTSPGRVKAKLKPNKALDENSSLSYGASPDIWNHSFTCHQTQVNVPHLNPSQ